MKTIKYMSYLSDNREKEIIVSQFLNLEKGSAWGVGIKSPIEKDAPLVIWFSLNRYIELEFESDKEALAAAYEIEKFCRNDDSFLDLSKYFQYKGDK